MANISFELLRNTGARDHEGNTNINSQGFNLRIGDFLRRTWVFLETWNERKFRDAAGVDVRFVQDNHSPSRRGVLRGLHYQIKQAPRKLVRVVRGRVYDLAVDLRKSSPTFGRRVNRFSRTADSSSQRIVG